MKSPNHFQDQYFTDVTLVCKFVTCHNSGSTLLVHKRLCKLSDIYLADPDETRCCSTNTLLHDWLVNLSKILFETLILLNTLSRFSNRVALSMCLSVRMFVPPGAVFPGLSLALRSHDQFQAYHRSSLPCPPGLKKIKVWHNSKTKDVT